jgi:ribosomal protein S14
MILMKRRSTSPYRKKNIRKQWNNCPKCKQPNGTGVQYQLCSKCFEKVRLKAEKSLMRMRPPAGLIKAIFGP